MSPKLTTEATKHQARHWRAQVTEIRALDEMLLTCEWGRISEITEARTHIMEELGEDFIKVLVQSGLVEDGAPVRRITTTTPLAVALEQEA